MSNFYNDFWKRENKRGTETPVPCLRININKREKNEQMCRLQILKLSDMD